MSTQGKIDRSIGLALKALIGAGARHVIIAAEWDPSPELSEPQQFAFSTSPDSILGEAMEQFELLHMAERHLLFELMSTSIEKQELINTASASLPTHDSRCKRVSARE